MTGCILEQILFRKSSSTDQKQERSIDSIRHYKHPLIFSTPILGFPVCDVDLLRVGGRVPRLQRRPFQIYGELDIWSSKQ